MTATYYEVSKVPPIGTKVRVTCNEEQYVGSIMCTPYFLGRTKPRDRRFAIKCEDGNSPTFSIARCIIEVEGFNVGDNVTWTSQGNGSTKAKHGRVVALVAAYSDPMTVLRHDVTKIKVPKYFDGSRRDHLSYLVAVRNIIYWPRVKGLKRDVSWHTAQ